MRIEERIARQRLGEGDEGIAVETPGDHRLAAAALAAQARRGLDILTPDLDKRVLDHGPFIDAVRALLTRNRHTGVRVLVHDAARAVKYGHRLIPLAHRLTSKIHFRNPGPAHRDRLEAFIVADGRGVLHRRRADRYEGQVHFNLPREALELTAMFDEMWREATPDPYIRRLHI